MKRPRDIVLYPHPVLRQRAKPVASVDAAIRGLVEEMFSLMRAEEGAGIAAPQVGEALRIFVTEEREEEGHPARVYINPVLSGFDGQLEEYDEGCLSLPGIRGNIRRPPKAVIEAIDLEGKPFRLESDHLEGTLILDRMTVLDRLRVRRLVKDLEADARG